MANPTLYQVFKYSSIKTTWVKVELHIVNYDDSFAAPFVVIYRYDKDYQKNKVTMIVIRSLAQILRFRRLYWLKQINELEIN